jgi:2-oxoglutarate dehydrogenase E2 component (dihydrolipoamide succinyltransferase)
VATDVVMPQMGESLAEGTVTKWLKQVGDKVERDEPLFEISTDKVDSVIPAPAGGYVTAIKVPEGTTVNINTVVAVIDAQPPAAGGGETAAAPAPAAAAAPPAASAPGSAPAPAPAPEPPAAAKPAAVPAAAAKAAEALARAESSLPRDTSPLGLNVKEIVVPRMPTPGAAPASPGGNGGAARPAPAPAAPGAVPGGGAATAAPPAPAGHTPLVHPVSGRVLTSPLVKHMARVENLDLRAVPGTGLGGRVTRADVVRALETRREGVAAQAQAQAAAPAAPAAGPFGLPAPSPSWLPQVQPGDRVEPMSRMRELIAQHMVFSKHTSPHVYTVFEFDLTRIAAIRAKQKAAFEQSTGVKLTFMPFILRATVHALRRNPILNASVRGNEVIHHASANIGIAVDLNPGLIVPVVKKAEEKSFLGLAKSLIDLADRARKKQLSPDDVQGGTFTITNPGVFGSLFGCPVINQPQVAILDVGGIVKRPVVISGEEGDQIAIRSICLMSVAYDHRVVDGASADHFMNDLRDYLEGWNEPLD